MKQFLRSLICKQLERRVVRLRKNHSFTVVAVAGSVGKTSTKLAVARLLAGSGKRVQYQEGNYNDRVSVPLVFFGLNMPSLYSIGAWLKVFGQMDRMIKQDYPYDVVVIELGTDGPGQLADFQYIQPDITVVTAISPEHMEQFGTLEAVAKEELSVAAYSKQLLVNLSDVPAEYVEGLDSIVGYSIDSPTQYRVVERGDSTLSGQSLQILMPNGALETRVAYSGAQGASIALAAIAVADMLGVEQERIAEAAAQLQPFSGRMQILEGVNDTTIIDDTYNNSPLAARAALDVLYSVDAPQKIAILGDMNELGEVSADEHTQLGAYCRADELAEVVTIGVKSREFLAPAAKEAGCSVSSFTSAKEAGDYVKQKLRPGAVVLAKGSQNGVFAEEAVKQLLKNPEDATKLVRQSAEWLAKK